MWDLSLSSKTKRLCRRGWTHGPELEEERIFDDRLARRLGVKSFRLPPPKPEKGGVPGTMAPLPYVRFPQWHFCPRCRALKKADLFAAMRPRCDNALLSPRLGGRLPCASRSERSRPIMVPLRFIAVCPAGHIEDFPWSGWAHTTRGKDLQASSKCGEEGLYFYPTKRGGLSGLMVACGKCESKRNLLGATSQDGLKGWICSGKSSMAWQGRVGALQGSARSEWSANDALSPARCLESVLPGGGQCDLDFRRTRHEYNKLFAIGG